MDDQGLNSEDTVSVIVKPGNWLKKKYKTKKIYFNKNLLLYICFL